MAVIGGLGTFIGPVLGGLSLEIISEYVKEFGNYHLLIFGLILVLVMRFSPMGITGLLVPKSGSKSKHISQTSWRREV
jgi:branched-chain amino acid transport system permease protein